MNKRSASRDLSRRGLLVSGGVTGAAAWLAALPAAAAVSEPSREVYTALGAKPFINCTATLTKNGGSQLLPEVIAAIEQASQYHVDLDDLMEAAGRRLRDLLKVEWGMVTSGAAAALTHATAACLAGTNPERMQQLPDLTGLKSEVVTPKSSRNQYDHAIRMLGVKMIEVDTLEQFQAAINQRTAMVAVLGNRFEKVRLPLEEVAPIARKAGIPVLVDAAPDYLVAPNPYIAAGASLVAYSGGKIIRGPQTAGLLVGEEKLVRAAFANASHHHAFGRPMKVSKEEIVGMTKAVEIFMTRRNLNAEYDEWRGWYDHIRSRVEKIAGVRGEVNEPSRGGPFPTLRIAWDPMKVGLTSHQVARSLLEGDPAVMVHDYGESHQILIRPVALKPGEHKLVAEALYGVLSKAPRGAAKPSPKPPAADLTGRWNLEIAFLAGSDTHQLHLQAEGDRIVGTHIGSVTQGEVKGAIDGDAVRFASVLPIEGSRLAYRFEGRVQGDRIEGTIDLDEYPAARFTATRHGYGQPARRDPSKA